MGYVPLPKWPDPDASPQEWAEWIDLVEKRIHRSQRDLLIILACSAIILVIIALLFLIR